MKNYFRVLVLCFCFGWLTCGVSARELTSQEKVLFDETAANARLVQEGFRRSLDCVKSWQRYADNKGPVITRFTGKTTQSFLWEPKNSAADNYAFMVLTTSFTDRAMYDGVMLEVLKNEKRYASDGVMPVDYPRINQFPEWFVASAGKKYVVNDLASDRSSVLSGSSLQDGYDVSLAAGKVRYFEVYEKK